MLAERNFKGSQLCVVEKLNDKLSRVYIAEKSLFYIYYNVAFTIIIDLRGS